MKEDDFLWIKLGLLKPRCERLRYEPPSAEARRRAGEIKQLLRETLGASLDEAGEPAFQFVAELSGNQIDSLRDPESQPAGDEADPAGTDQCLCHGRLLDLALVALPSNR